MLASKEDEDMLIYIIICFAGFLIGIIFRAAAMLRLGIPLLYTLVLAFGFPMWAHEHQELSMMILYGLLALCAVSWIVTIAKKIRTRKIRRDYQRMEEEMMLEQLKIKQGIAV